MRDVASLTRHLARPAIHVLKCGAPTRSHFGGIPDLPKDVPWPAWRRGKLAFLARIALTELRLAHSVPWLPQSGALLFFYDIENEPWGFDPGDRGGAKVLFLPDVGRTDP